MPPRASTALIKPGSLWPVVQATTAHALRTGALQPIATNAERVFDEHVAFVVRLARGEVTKSSSGGNPFRQPDPDLLVGAIDDRYCCLLNKFCVTRNHILLVTHEFVAQSEPLEEADFAAVLMCLREFDCLVFFNSGPTAGASQRHRHLQAVPLAPVSEELPLEARIMQQLEKEAGQPSESVPLPFRHRLTPAPPAEVSVAEAASDLARVYRRMKEETEADSYNLLLTRRWMMLVPRTRETFASISLNALAFAGYILVWDGHQLERLRAAGPFAALAAVTEG